MAHYHFVTTWRFQAPLQQIWEALYDYPNLPHWWKSVKQVRVIRHVKTDHGVGSVFDCVWRGVIPYSLHFRITVTEVEWGKKIVGLATGDLIGSGTWLFTREDDTTVVTYIWDVRTTKRWMNVVAPVARPIFHWAHDQVMREGEDGLRQRLARTADQFQTEKQENAAENGIQQGYPEGRAHVEVPET